MYMYKILLSHYNLIHTFLINNSIFIQHHYRTSCCKLETKKTIDKPSRLTDVGASRSSRGVIAAYVLAIGVNCFLNGAVVVVANAIVSVIVFIKIESWRASDVLSAEVLQPKIEVPSSIGVRFVNRLFFVIKAGIVDRRSPSDPA